MALKNYIFIILISVVTGLFVGWLTGSLLFSLLGMVVMVVINLKDVLVKYLKSEINIEVEQEIENRKIHTSNLRNAIELWQKKLQDKDLRKNEPAEKTGNPNKFWELDTSFIDEIEKDTLIREKDIYYHFSDLEKLWIDFKDLILISIPRSSAAAGTSQSNIFKRWYASFIDGRVKLCKPLRL